MRSTKSLYVAVGTLVLTMVVGTYVDLQSDAMNSRHLEINTGLERMVRLNGELTNMLVIAVLEKNTLRTASYDTVNADLTATLATLGQLTKQQTLSQEISALSDDREQLRQTEETALQLMRRDMWQEAHQLMFADSYVLARKLYEINSETAVGALTGELAHTGSHFDRIRAVAAVARVVAVLLLLWAGTLFSRQLRNEVAEQARLRKEIAQTNELLEEKVHQRTAELESANRQLQTLSATDALTSLANRRSFDLAWEAEWQRASRQAQPLAIAMIDVDQFKAYNDHYGHQMGDQCLKMVAQSLGLQVQRSGDLVARYGGEEFVVVLPGLAGPEAFLVMERIRLAIQTQGIPHAKATQAGVVTISVGVASCLPQKGESSEALVQRADEAMYQAKNQGRNQVVLAAL